MTSRTWSTDAAKVTNVKGDTLWGGLPPVGSIIPWIGGSYDSNGTYTRILGATDNVAGANAFLPANWRICNGALLNDPESPIFTGAGKYLPNLTDDRFLMGNTICGEAVGGANTSSITTTNMPSHNHSIPALSMSGVNANHTHNWGPQTTAGESGHVHTNPWTNGTTVDHAHSLLAGPLLSPGTNGLVIGEIYPTAFDTYGQTGDHQHSINNTGSATSSHTHTVPVGPTDTESADHSHLTNASTTGSSGSGTDFDTVPKYLPCFYIMRIK